MGKNLTFDTSIVSIRLESWRTELADSFVVLHFTGSIICTNLALTRVLALIVDTGLVRWTAAVLQTDGHRRVAALNADTSSFVVQHLAVLTLRTNTWVVARIRTTAVDTAQI